MDNEITPTAPLTASPRLLDFVSRLRRLVTTFLQFRAEAKALKEEFIQLALAGEFKPEIWNGDNPALGAHRHLTPPDVFLALNALDTGENALVTGGHVAALLRVKE